jgi:hypothetical protein
MLWMARIADGLELVLVMDSVRTDVSHEHLDASDRFKIRMVCLGVLRGLYDTILQ